MNKIQKLYGYVFSLLTINAVSYTLDSVISNTRFLSFILITFLFFVSFKVNPSESHQTFPFAFQLKYRGLPHLK